MNATATAVPEARRYNAGAALANLFTDVLALIVEERRRQQRLALRDRAILYGQLSSVPGFTDYMRRQLEQWARSAPDYDPNYTPTLQEYNPADYIDDQADGEGGAA